jgi:hypothetical protein
VVTFGLDISHHQELSLNLRRAGEENVDFVFIKSTEGATYRDPEFVTNLAEARAADLLVAAYHFVRNDASAAAQAINVTRVVPLDVPIILDVEETSGGVSLVRELIYMLRTIGYVVPLLYLPRWYWQELGSPSLAGLPPLWSSRYPDNVVGSLSDEWADVPSHYWNGYGGLDVAVLQFTSSARVAGYAPIDANAFRGTRDELAALLGQEEDDMFTNGDRDDLRVAAWRLLTLLNLEDRVPNHAGVPEAARDEELKLVVEFKKLQADVAELRARPVADVDEVALAAELEARGITGPTLDEVVQAVRTVFADAGSEVE